MFHIALCDKDPAKIKSLTHNIQSCPDPPDTICIHPFTEAEELVDECRDGARYSLVILETMTGAPKSMDTARVIRSYDKQVPIMMVSPTNQYCAEGYEIPLYRYHENPIPVETLWSDLKNLMAEPLFPQTSSLVFRNWEGIHKILMKDILYLMTTENRLVVKTATEEYSLRGSITATAKKLNRYHFYRCHKSYLVNLHHIRSLTGEEVHLDTGEALPVAKKRARNLRIFLENTMGEKI